MLPGQLPHRVTIKRRTPTGELDRGRNPVVTYVDDPRDRPARVDPMGTNEELGDRERVTRRYLVLLDDAAPPPGPADRIVWTAHDLTIELDGDVMLVDDGFGRFDHYEAEGLLITGG